jgi:hypothetical protein
LSTASDNFEKFVHRVHELIETPNAQVVWNDHVPDPDNPRQPRQIDVSIRRDGRLTLVECRLHRTRQGVKWIEELIGRRASLQASEVIAVSDAGFTLGAIRKAKRFGVELRDLENLTDAEISNWGRTHRVFLYFYTFQDLHLTLVLDLPVITPTAGNAIADAFRTSQSASPIFNAIVEALDAEQWLPKRVLDRDHAFSYELHQSSFRLASAAVSLVKASGRVRLVERQVECRAVRAYGPPAAVASKRNVVVEQFNLGDTGLVHHNQTTSFVVDVTTLQMPALSQLCFVRLAGDVETDLASFEIIGAERFRISAGAIQLTLAARS